MKKFHTLLAITIVAFGCLCRSVLAAGTIKVNDLRCEYLVDPLGVDVGKPRLSWQLESGRRAQKQTACRLLVAGSRDKLDKNIGDLWDTGKVVSGQSLNVVYGGKPLKSRQQYFWKVKVWDKDDQASDWSRTVSWGMGILNQDDWKGGWIKSDIELYDYQKELKKLPDHNMQLTKEMWTKSRSIRKMTADVKEAPAVWLRKEFAAEKKLRRGTAYISGLGFYELYLNGKKVGDSYFHTTVCDYSKTVPYLVHDVTDKINNGNNAIGVILGNGYFNPVIPGALREYVNDFIDTPRLRCDLKLEYTDGTIDHVVSDQSWRYTTDGPIRVMFMSFPPEVAHPRISRRNWIGRNPS